MALSEYEQRLLDQIEDQLMADDPAFASHVSKARSVKLRRRRPVLCGSLFLLGLVLLAVGVVVSQSAFVIGIAVSVLGFLGMVAGAALFAFGLPGDQHQPAPERKVKSGGGITDRMEDRLRRRFDS